MEQVAHRDHRCAGGDKIVEYDYVALGWWLFNEGKDSPDTMFRVTLGEIFVKVHAQECCEPCGNQRCKIAFLVATLRRGDDAPVAGGERVAEYLPDKGIHTHGEFPDHIGVAFDVGESPAIKRLFQREIMPKAGLR